VQVKHYQNPSSKRAWFQRLKLQCDGLLSKVAFNFNLRRCIEGETRKYRVAGLLKSAAGKSRSGGLEGRLRECQTDLEEANDELTRLRAGAYTRSHFSST